MGVAAVHYFYMREFWIQIHSSPILYRYIDWSITVPLQMIEFNLILKAVQPDISAGMFWRLLVGTVMMLTFGYCGESSIIGAWVGRDLRGRGWQGVCRHEPACAGLLQHHAFHRHHRLGHLPRRLLPRVLDRRRR